MPANNSNMTRLSRRSTLKGHLIFAESRSIQAQPVVEINGERAKAL